MKSRDFLTPLSFGLELRFSFRSLNQHMFQGARILVLPLRLMDRSIECIDLGPYPPPRRRQESGWLESEGEGRGGRELGRRGSEAYLTFGMHRNLGL